MFALMYFLSSLFQNTAQIRHCCRNSFVCIEVWVFISVCFSFSFSFFVSFSSPSPSSESCAEQRHRIMSVCLSVCLSVPAEGVSRHVCLPVSVSLSFSLSTFVCLSLVSVCMRLHLICINALAAASPNFCPHCTKEGGKRKTVEPGKNREQGVESREQRPGSREQRPGSREQATGDCEAGSESSEKCAKLANQVSALF